MPYCSVCNTSVDRKGWVGHLRSSVHKNKILQPYCDGVELITSAFRSRIASYRLTALNQSDMSSIDNFFAFIKSKIEMLLNECLKRHICVKVNFELFALFLLFKNDSQEVKSFATKNFILLSDYEIDSLLSSVTNNLKKKVEEFQERDSGWTLLTTSHLEINVNKYQPLGGSSYIDLPKYIKTKKACLNIHNNDKYCFLWCVTAALYPSKKHPDRVSSYPDFRDILNISGMSFPVKFSDIKTFETNNQLLSFIIYGIKNKTIVGPLYKSRMQTKKCIHLLLIENGSTSHYCLIKDLSRLVRKQITNHHGKLYLCDTCLVFFKSCEDLNRHVCGGVATILPKKGSYIKFKNFERKQDIPFIIYADFETMLKQCVDIQQSAKATNTSIEQQHVPVAFSYYIVSTTNNSYNKLVSYRGSDCVNKFVQYISEDAKKIYEVLNRNVPMLFTESDANDFRNATKCHICNHMLFSVRVRDHCHVTGRYRGAAHRHCNLQYKIPKFIPVVFHNLSGYDSHLFIKKLGTTPGTITVIAKNKENYISFTKYIPISHAEFVLLRFIDSYKFLGTSLDQLSKTMKITDFTHLREHFPCESEFQLLTRKGVYPYDYMCQWDRYDESSLPSKEKFYNSLNSEEISDTDYEHACLVWTTFNIQNLGHYTDLYLKTDVLLLTDIYEKFRKTCKKHYGLDPAFYLTAPSLSFDAMLLKTDIELELLEDLSMVRMIQSGIRGGVCMCSHRFVKANNYYMSDYDPSKDNIYLTYLDCNNLYGFSMCQYLPFSDFRFMTDAEIDALDVCNVSDDAPFGFILEVDLVYPRHLHFEHNDLPFCPEKCIPPDGKNYKLVANLYDKYNYVIHYIHLKKCLQNGLKLKKIHRVISFQQSPYLKQYIDFNTSLRQKAETVFEQDFFKLLNNSIFGKTLENTEKRVEVVLVNEFNITNNKTKKRLSADRLIARPNFHSASVFTENLVAIQLRPDRVFLDKPIYIGFSVLELSKSHMYDFHYSVIKPLYSQQVQLCYTDTDSYIYAIKTLDFYDDLKRYLLPYFDSSNYKIDNQYDLPLHNKKVPGLFKDEMAGEIITKFVGLRSKLYCIQTEKCIIKKAKGVKKCVTRDLNVSCYERSLFYNEIIRKKNMLFKSIKHEIFTRSTNKIALSSNDDKRIVFKNRASTLAWGHTALFKKNS